MTSKRFTLFRRGRLKRILPKSLFGRAMLIITLPIALMQIIVAYIFFDAHWQSVTASLSESVAADIAVAVTLFEQDPSAMRAQDLDNMLRPKMQLSIALAEEKPLPEEDRLAFFSALDKTLRRSLSDKIKNDFWFDTTRYPHHIDIRVVVDDGVLRFIVPRERVFAPTGFIFLFWMIMATAVLTLVSILFILNQARPIVRLANAAEAFGKGRSIGDFKPSGASEVRQAGRAFLQMRDRIFRHVQQRTILLAGVSHDLRTPLTRLKLHLAMTGDNDETRAAQNDLADMERMLDGYLDFARGIAEEDMQKGDIAALINAIIDTAPAPKPKADIPGPIEISMRPLSIKRAFSNLIGNAQTYGTSVQLSAKAQNKRLTVIIDDDGPGIEASKREDAFKPFHRFDEARNQNIKGVGLGLSIARDIFQAHGGNLVLADSPLGGLRCIVTLPL